MHFYFILLTVHWLTTITRPFSSPQWFDGGYGGDMAAGIKTIIAQQKLAVGFGGSGVMDSPVGWVGTESGYFLTWA